jgi:hypothetical protein
MHRCQRLVHPSEQFWNWFCGMAFRAAVVLFLMSLVSSKCLSFNIFFIFKSHWGPVKVNRKGVTAQWFVYSLRTLSQTVLYFKLRHSRDSTSKHTQTIIDATQKEIFIDQQQHSREMLICQRYQTILRFLSTAATASTGWGVRELYCQTSYAHEVRNTESQWVQVPLPFHQQCWVPTVPETSQVTIKFFSYKGGNHSD